MSSTDTYMTSPIRSSRRSTTPSSRTSRPRSRRSTSQSTRQTDNAASSTQRSTTASGRTARSSRPKVTFVEPVSDAATSSQGSAATTDYSKLAQHMKTLKRHLAHKTFTETWGPTTKTDKGSTYNKLSIWADLGRIRKADPSLFSAEVDTGISASDAISNAQSMLSNWTVQDTDYSQYAPTLTTLRSALATDPDRPRRKKTRKSRNREKSRSSRASSGATSRATRSTNGTDRTSRGTDRSRRGGSAQSTVERTNV